MPFLKRECVLAARVRDRVDRGLRARERRDARDAGDERGLADQVAVAACPGALRRVDDEVAASAADQVDDRGAVCPARRPCAPARPPARRPRATVLFRRSRGAGTRGPRARPRPGPRPACLRRAPRGRRCPRSAAAVLRPARPWRRLWENRRRSPSPLRSSASPARGPDRSRGTVRRAALPPSRRHPVSDPGTGPDRTAWRPRRAGRPPRRG